MPLVGHPLPLPIFLQLLEVLKAAWKHYPGPGGGFCLGLEASAAALSEALSKSFPLPLGQSVFIFQNFQQMETEASPGKMCLLPQPSKKQVGVVAWRGRLSGCHQRNQFLGRILSLQSLLRSAYLSSSYACS